MPPPASAPSDLGRGLSRERSGLGQRMHDGTQPRSEARWTRLPRILLRGWKHMGRLPGNAVQRNAGRSELGGGETPLRLREQRLQRRLPPLQAGARSDAMSMMLPAQRTNQRVKHTPLSAIPVFLQVVWAQTSKVGCAAHACPNGVQATTFADEAGAILVCNYASAWGKLFQLCILWLPEKEQHAEKPHR